MSAGGPGDITQILEQTRAGDRDAYERLMPLVYGEMRQLAARYLRRERIDHTLQPTALVHEAFLKLIGQRHVDWKNRAHFFGIAAQAMRRILVDHARSVGRTKRGGAERPVSIDDVQVALTPRPIDLIALDDALQRLGELDPQQSRVIELRYFGGLSIEETAEVLGVSSSTVKREWTMARAWLYHELGGTLQGPSTS
jgi:RNA polymerase sigma factor (TIGR02999 family)